MDEILVTICCSTALWYLGHFVNALVIVISNSSKYLDVIANINVSDLVGSGRSFMYSTKSYGPITEPWGIPEVTLCHFDSLPFTATFCFLSVRNASIQFINSLLLAVFIDVSNILRNGCEIVFESSTCSLAPSSSGPGDLFIFRLFSGNNIFFQLLLTLPSLY